MISRILVTTDGSEVAWKAIDYAMALAKQTGATIRALSVIEKGFFFPPSVPDMTTLSRLKEPLDDFLQRAADAFVGRVEELCAEKGVPSERAIRFGHPVEEIIREAEEGKVDLIVMGSHGKSALKAALVGSVAFGVIHQDTKIPVLVVRR